METRSRIVVSLVLFYLLACFSALGVTPTPVSGTISANTTWTLANSPYSVTADVTVDAGVTLTIEPGTIVKFAYSPTTSPPHGSYSYKTRMFINGTLVAAGTDSSPIVFTSERDDNHGGDSNGDGVATLPEAGGWGYIKINGDGSVLEWCVFEYGGIGRLSSVSAYSSEAYTSHTYMLWITEPDVYITRCLFTHAYDKAIYVVESSVNSRTVISSSTFEHSPMGIEFYGNGQEGSEFIVTGNSFDSGSVGVKVTRAGSYVGISRNHFDNLSSYGVQNTDSSSTVIAEGNWWGADDGPDGAGSGSGVDVSAYVNYSSWWTEPDADQNGVWNVIAVRRGTSMIIDIYYDLVGAYGTTYQVGLSVSTTGGEPYTISPASGSLSGTGSGKSPGDGLHIVWDAAAGGGSGYTDQMRVKVTADIE